MVQGRGLAGLRARFRTAPSHLTGRTKYLHEKFSVFYRHMIEHTRAGVGILLPSPACRTIIEGSCSPLLPKGLSRLNRRRAATVFVVVLAVAAAVAALRYAGPNFHWAEFSASFRTLDPAWAAFSLLLNLLTYGARIFRWRIMMRPVRATPRMRNLTSATAIGFTAIIFFGRPGELVRPWLIARRENVSFSSQAAAWFLERIFDLLSVVLLFGAALVGIGPSSAAGSQRIQQLLRAGGYLALVAGIGCIVFLGLSAVFSERARQLCDLIAGRLPQRFAHAVRHSLDSFLAGLACTGSLRSVMAILAWTIVEWWLVCAGIYSLFHSFGPTQHFTWNNTLVFTGFVAFGSVIQLPGIGGGIQVASVLILTELFGLSLEPATACTLLVWGTSWLSIMPFGVLFAFFEGLRWGSLKDVRTLEGEA